VRALLAAAAVSLVLAVTAAADPPQAGIVHPVVPPGTPLVELGRQLYAGNCASCHGSDGRGVAPPAPNRGAGDITAAGPSLRGVGALSADFYLRTGYMPLGDPYDQPRRGPIFFSDRELDALVAFVASLGDGPPVPQPHPEHGDVADGLRLFTRNCAGCHQVVGEGGYVTDAVAPPLRDPTSVQIAEAVRIGPYLMPHFSRRQIDDRHLDSIIAYVQAAKNPEDAGGWGIGHIGPVPEGLVTWLIAAVAAVGVCLLVGRRLHG